MTKKPLHQKIADVIFEQGTIHQDDCDFCTTVYGHIAHLINAADKSLDVTAEKVMDNFRRAKFYMYGLEIPLFVLRGGSQFLGTINLISTEGKYREKENRQSYLRLREKGRRAGYKLGLVHSEKAREILFGLLDDLTKINPIFASNWDAEKIRATYQEGFNEGWAEGEAHSLKHGKDRPDN